MKWKTWKIGFVLPPNTTEILKTTTERIKTITEHLKVTTEHIFFITIREFLISCWETKFYHNVHIFTELILIAEHFLLQPIDLIFMQKNNHLSKSLIYEKRIIKIFMI